MSPEMQNDEDYDYKTDICSYGIILFVLFTGRLPKQSLRDSINKTPINLPSPSPEISQFCIDLIRDCISIDSSKRPSFDEILDKMNKNSFKFADDVDSILVQKRFQELYNINGRNGKL